MPAHRTLLLAAGALLLAGGAPATAAEPVETGSQTSPAYPGNTLSAALTGDGPVVAGTFQVADLAGHAEFGDDITTYTPSVFLQDSSRGDTQCAPTLDQQRQKYLNDQTIDANNGFGPWVMDEGQYRIGPAPGTLSADWRTQTQRFVIRPGVSQVMLCTYLRYIVDDVAVHAARYAVEQPSCKPTRSRVRAGRSLTITCNFTGRVSARLKRGGKTVKRTLDLGERRRATFSTRGARKGSNGLAFSLDGKRYGKALRVRVT